MAQHARGEISLVYTPQDSRQQLTRRDEKLNHTTAHDFPYPQPTRGRSKWWLFGYDRQSSVVLWGVFSAAIIAFCLARAPMMSFQQLLKMTTPGEGYWYEQAPWKGSVLIHVITATISSFFSVFCFLPITFQRWPRFHSILGYAVTLLLLVSMASGSLLGRRSQGGELNFQAGVYMIGSMTAYAGVMGILEARNRAYDKHREWMLRAWFYNGTLLTTRLTALISSHVVTALNGYYSLWKCGEVAYVLKSIDILAQMFPQCATPSALADPNGTQVPVHASRRDGDLGLASATRASFGMALWVAMILHVLGIEFYLRATASESKWLRRWPEERGPGASQEQMELPYRSS